MKILIINAGSLPIPSVKGGAVENLTEMAISDQSITKGNDITVVSVYNEVAQKKSSDFNCKFIYIKETVMFKFFRILRTLFNRLNFCYIGNEYIHEVYKYLKKNNSYYDKVIIENAPRFALILKHKFSDELILHLHNDYLSPHEKFGEQIINEFDEIYCNSKFVISEVNRVISTNKTKLLYNGIDLNRFRSLGVSDINRNMYNIHKNDKVFIYSGRIVPEKGICELIEAFTSLKQNNCKLLVIGSLNGASKKFRKRILELINNNSNIILSGYIPYEEIHNLYSLGYFGVVPSKCNEAFGLSALEMLAAGLPVICSDDGALSEIVNDECGYIVSKKKLVSNLKAKILVAINLDSSIYEKMSSNAILSSKSFSKEKYISNFKKMIS